MVNRVRKFLSRQQTWGSRKKVYEVPGGLEIDEFDQYDVIRKRVFFDDVLFVTYHRYYGTPFLVLTGLWGGLYLLIGLLILSERNGGAPATVFFIISLTGFIPMALRLLLMVDCITIFGKRSKAQLLFSFRKARAREIFRDLTEKIRQTQEQLGAEIAAEQAQQEADAPQTQNMPEMPPGPPLVPPTAPPVSEPPPTLIPPTQ